MTDRWIVLFAASIFMGAFVKFSLPIVFSACCVAFAFIFHSRIAACITCGLLASSLSWAWWSALDEPLPLELDGVGILVSDPESKNGAIRSEVKLSGRIYQAWFKGDLRTEIEPMLAGQKVMIKGLVGPLSGMTAPSLRRKHVAGRIVVTEVKKVSNGNPLTVVTNQFRERLERGSTSLAEDDRALLTGFVLGDDRRQSEELRNAFLDSGLTHLLAVSGQNVAFVFLIVSPFLSRFSLFGRLIVGTIVLITFGTLTRWEPSVVRAEAMVFVSLLATYIGRPISPLRALLLASSGAVLVDPFLVGSIGFLLSVSACLGMVALGEAISGRLPGPVTFGRVIGYSTAAQLGVAPVQYLVFDGIPVVSIIANVFVEPIAGVVMVWGSLAGELAGLLGEPFATLLHVPTSMQLWYVKWVAYTASGMNLGFFSIVHLLILGVLASMALLIKRYRQQDDNSSTRLSGQRR